MDSFPFCRGHNILCAWQKEERAVTGTRREALTEICYHRVAASWGNDRRLKRKRQRGGKRKKNTCKSKWIMKGRKPYMVRGVDLVEGDQEACEKKLRMRPASGIEQTIQWPMGKETNYPGEQRENENQILPLQWPAIKPNWPSRQESNRSLSPSSH